MASRTIDERRAPGGPSELRTGSWLGVLKRTAKEFSNDNLTDWAAALTYYGVLAIFRAAQGILLRLIAHRGCRLDRVLRFAQPQYRLPGEANVHGLRLPALRHNPHLREVFWRDGVHIFQINIPMPSG